MFFVNVNRLDPDIPKNSSSVAPTVNSCDFLRPTIDMSPLKMMIEIVDFPMENCLNAASLSVIEL